MIPRGQSSFDIIFSLSVCRTQTRILIYLGESSFSWLAEWSRGFTKWHEVTEIPLFLRNKETVSVEVPGSKRFTQNTDFLATPLNEILLLVLPPTTTLLRGARLFFALYNLKVFRCCSLDYISKGVRLTVGDTDRYITFLHCSDKESTW